MVEPVPRPFECALETLRRARNVRPDRLPKVSCRRARQRPTGAPAVWPRARDEDLRPGLRSFPVGEYVIIYRIQDEDVLILRVLRGSRDIAVLFGR